MKDMNTITPEWAFEQAKPMEGDWLKNRVKLITGTDSAAILGLSPWATPFDVWLSKAGQLPAQEDTSPMRWGRNLEPIILSSYEEETGRSIIPNATCYQSRQHPHLGGTPDAFGETDPIIPDAKNIRFLGPDWGEAGTDLVPFHYLVQMQHYMAVTGASQADLAVLVGGNELRIYPIEQDSKIQGHIIEEANRFWRDHVATGNPPEKEASPAASAWLLSQFPKQKDDLREADHEECELINQLQSLERRQSKIKEQIADIEFKLKEAIADHEGLTGDFGKVTWKYQKERVVKEHKRKAGRTFRKNWK